MAEREGGKRERDGGLSLYIDDDVIRVMVGGEPNGFWEYGGRCLGNRSVGPAYVMSQVLEVLMPTMAACTGHHRFKSGGPSAERGSAHKPPP